MSDKELLNILENKQSEMSDEDDIFEKTDQAVEYFHKGKFSKEIKEIWDTKYSKNPETFFSNLKEIEDMPVSQRFCLFARASLNMVVTPDMADKYFDAFPEDLEAVKSIYDFSGGMPGDGITNTLFQLSAKRMADDDPRWIDRDYRNKNYYETSLRLNEAYKYILNGTEIGASSLAKFGKAANGYKKVIRKASELVMDGFEYINPEDIFTQEYKKLSENEKADFLRGCIRDLHYYLLFEETYNSCFTKENVENRDRIEKKGDNGFSGVDDIILKALRTRPVVAHSYIFGTPQPSQAYNRQQDFFESEMNSTAMTGGDIEEYPYHRIMMVILREIKDINVDQDENTDLLVDFWNKNRNPIFANGVVNALESQDKKRAIGKLLELINDKDTRNKNAIAAVLFRLELGEIGISEKGVKYLEKIFDLGDMNDPDFFVKRLTAKGEIGIFDKERILQKYFQITIEDLDNQSAVIKKEALEFTYETLFFAQEDETSEQRAVRERYLKEFRENYFNFYEDRFFKETGIFFNNLNFKEQGWFLLAFKSLEWQIEKDAKLSMEEIFDEKDSASTEELAKRSDTRTNAQFAEIDSANRLQKALLDFASENGENGLKSFLTLEFEEGNGQKIIDIANKLAPEQSQLIFSKLAELIELADKENEEISDIVFKDKRQANFTAAKLNLLKKAHIIISDFSDVLSDEKAVGSLIEKKDAGGIYVKNKAINELLVKLDKVNIEISLLSSVLKNYKLQNEKIDLNLIKDLTMEYEHRMEDEKIKEILELVKKSWQENVEQNGVNQKFADIIVNNLERDLRQVSPSTEIILLKYKEKVVGLIRFKKIDTKTFEVKSVNILSDLKGLDVGKFLLGTAGNKSEENDMVLDVLLKNQIGTYYVNNLGFEAYGINDDAFGTGEPNLYARRNAGSGGDKHEKADGDIEVEFNLSEGTGFSDFRKFLKEKLLIINDNGEIEPGQDVEEKYVLIRYEKLKESKDDIRRVVCRKNKSN